MNFKKLIPYAKAEMQKMTDDEFIEAVVFLSKEIVAETDRRDIEDIENKIIEAVSNV